MSWLYLFPSEIDTREKRQHLQLFKGFHSSLFSPWHRVLNYELQADCTSTRWYRWQPQLPTHHPLFWPWHQWQPIDLWLNPSLPVDSSTVLAYCVQRGQLGCTHSFVKWWWTLSCYFWGLVHVGRLKVCLLMRAVSRLRLQMNRMQCSVWPFDFRF